MEFVPIDRMRVGFAPKENVISHPVEIIQNTNALQADRLKQFTATNIFGSHLQLRMQMEQTILAGYQRLPGLHSELSGLQTIMGCDEDIGFEDYLNDPVDSIQEMNTHEVMEKRLGLGVDKLHLRV